MDLSDFLSNWDLFTEICFAIKTKWQLFPLGIWLVSVNVKCQVDAGGRALPVAFWGLVLLHEWLNSRGIYKSQAPSILNQASECLATGPYVELCFSSHPSETISAPAIFFMFYPTKVEILFFSHIEDRLFKYLTNSVPSSQIIFLMNPAHNKVLTWQWVLQTLAVICSQYRTVMCRISLENASHLIYLALKDSKVSSSL